MKYNTGTTQLTSKKVATLTSLRGLKKGRDARMMVQSVVLVLLYFWLSKRSTKSASWHRGESILQPKQRKSGAEKSFVEIRLWIDLKTSQDRP
jgi:hypothetical protein